MAPKRGIPLAALENLIRKCGAERVADSGKLALQEALDDIAKEISRDAVKFENNTGRKTVKAYDIKLAEK